MIEKQNIFHFKDFGIDLKDVIKAEQEDYSKLDNWLRSIEQDEPAIFSLNNVEFIGYSYSKQTIRRSIQNMLDGHYRISSIFLRYDGNDIDIKLDAINYSLVERHITCILINGPIYRIIGYIPSGEDNELETTKEKSKREKMKAIMELLLVKRELYTNQLSKLLKLKLAYSNRLLDELAKMRLVQRFKESSPTGGPIYLNRSVVADLL